MLIHRRVAIITLLVFTVLFSSGCALKKKASLWALTGGYIGSGGGVYGTLIGGVIGGVAGATVGGVSDVYDALTPSNEDGEPGTGSTP